LLEEFFGSRGIEVWETLVTTKCEEV